MVAAFLATLLAVLTFAVGRHACAEELRTGRAPASLNWLVAIIFLVGGPIFYFMDKSPFFWALACDLLGMLLAIGLVYFGYGLARPLWRALRQQQ